MKFKSREMNTHKYVLIGMCYHEVSFGACHLKVRDMSFMVGTVLFVVVLGIIDSRLPWPRPGSRRGRP
jgi:hypothetical protein